MSSNLEGPAPSTSSPRLGSSTGTQLRSGHLSDTKFRDIFNEMRLSGEMCDVQIQVEEATFQAHKLILAGCSPYFRGMVIYFLKWQPGHFPVMA